MAVTMKIVVFWVAMPCSLEFRWNMSPPCSGFYFSTLKMEEAYSTESSVCLLTKRAYKTENHTL
jgi:hypothetical protein